MIVTVSLVICTRNRAARLRTCLQYVGAIQARIPWELVVVDNGSSDDTQAVLREFAPTCSAPINMVSELRRGMGPARNTAWRTASGEIIAFTDDDCYVSPDFIDAIAEVFTPNDRLGYVGGRILLHDPKDARLTINESEERLHFPRRTLLWSGAVQGANMIIRRIALEDIGGFDERLGYGTPFAAADIDAATRASFAGWEGAYEPRIVVRHHHGRKEADAPRVMKIYAHGRGAYWMKMMLRPDTRKPAYWQWRSLLKSRFRDRSRRPELVQEFVGGARYLAKYGWRPSTFAETRLSEQASVAGRVAAKLRTGVMQ